MLYQGFFHSKKQCDAFMTDAFITPDYYTYFRSTRMKWACELGLQTSRLRPNVIFDDPEFVVVRESSYSIEVDLQQWLQFMNKLAALMRDDNTAKKNVMRRAFILLQSYEKELDICECRYEKEKKLPKDLIKRLFELYTSINCFSIINMSIPIDYYDKIINKYIISDNITCDVLLQPTVSSDRILLREGMLRQALNFINFNEICFEELEKVLTYATFDQWIFQDDLFSNQHIVRKEILSLVKTYGKQGILSELKNYKIAHEKANLDRLKLIAAVGEKASLVSGTVVARNVIEKISFLSAAVTEEEIRHRLECRHFLLLGRILRDLSLDVTRSDLKDIYMAIEYQQDNSNEKVV